VVTPAVVKEGFLAPYQELAVITTPLAHEERFIAEEGERFAALIRAVEGPDLGSLPFAAWLERRTGERRSTEGAAIPWSEVERTDPAFALAALRRCWHRALPVPEGARLREQHRRPPDAADWAALLDAWALEALAPSDDPRDGAAWQHLADALPSVGYRLTRTGVRRTASVVDRVLALSGAKALAAARILEAERAALGDRLRALVLCDYESAGRDPGRRLRGILDPGAGSAALVLRTLLDGTAGRGRDPVMVTGRTVATSRATAERLVRFARDDPDAGPVLASWDPLSPASDATLAAAGIATGGWDDVVIVDPPDPAWSPVVWVPLITRFFEAGQTHCLVGTRALLGEGWDSHPVNVVVDLTAATTPAAVHQMRGRGLRLDPAEPRKVTDDWDVACVSPGHPQGDADYARFVRKHRHFFALTADGEIESGVSHVDASLSPYDAPDPAAGEALSRRLLARPSTRAATHAAWAVGEPYRDVPVGTVRVAFGRSPGLPGTRLLRAAPPRTAGGRASRHPREMLLVAAAATVAGAVAGGLAGALAVGIAATAVLAVLALSALRDGIAALTPSDTLGDLARAVADGLVEAGLSPAEAGAAAVRVVPRPDGHYRCSLDGVDEAASTRFAEALDELLAPLWDPSWLIPRRVVTAPPTLAGAARVAAERLGGRVRPATQVWHAVPSVLAGRRDRVAAFERAWRRWVSPGATAIRAREPAGAVVLALRRGDDPFAVETQLRTLWT
jgi:hypothetical protein